MKFFNYIVVLVLLLPTFSQAMIPEKQRKRRKIDYSASSGSASAAETDAACAERDPLHPDETKAERRKRQNRESAVTSIAKKNKYLESLKEEKAMLRIKLMVAGVPVEEWTAEEKFLATNVRWEAEDPMRDGETTEDRRKRKNRASAKRSATRRNALLRALEQDIAGLRIAVAEIEHGGALPGAAEGDEDEEGAGPAVADDVAVLQHDDEEAKDQEIAALRLQVATQQVENAALVDRVAALEAQNAAWRARVEAQREEIERSEHERGIILSLLQPSGASGL